MSESSDRLGRTDPEAQAKWDDELLDECPTLEEELEVDYDLPDPDDYDIPFEGYYPHFGPDE